MCGIAGIILKRPLPQLRETIAAMSNALAHRGPDGEGFALASGRGIRPYRHASRPAFTRTDLKYLPGDSLDDADSDAFLAFGHRRLSIIDLSEAGHQPMCDSSGQIWLTYNGEIYNYIELREELRGLGHSFASGSDSEVIIAAYKQWGARCVEQFNGMWSFCIYDAPNQCCFASRDRLGVKPFYYLDTAGLFAFASEQKAFIRSGLCAAAINPKELHNYLVNTRLETGPDNFFRHITELMPGHNLVYDLRLHTFSVKRYFHIEDIVSLENDHLTERDLVQKIEEVFYNAVKIRLRSDVEVGTCLSGGIDSSALAVTITAINHQPPNCFTSVFRGREFNEEPFADLVAKQIGARHFKTAPDLEGLMAEIDTLVYSQDVPIWDSSTYAQYKVMELAASNNIKVVLDGQGADELFTGYHHHFIARWNNLQNQGHYLNLIGDIASAGKSIPSPFLFFLKEKIKSSTNLNTRHLQGILKKDFLAQADIQNPSEYAGDVNTQLIKDIYETRLKAFLKCEDRCGMWHSVESRTPFSDDIGLIRLMFSFDAGKKIKNGVLKHLLREALRNKLPAEIYTRYDKRGFETPMQEWVQQMRPQMLASIQEAKFDFIRPDQIEKSDPGNPALNKLLFRLFVLSRWQQAFG